MNSPKQAIFARVRGSGEVMADFRLGGRTALVTGSTRGIGRALAEALARQGAAVAVHGTQAGDATLASIRERGGRAESFTADLGDAQACGHLVEQVEARLGPVDILLLNASFEARESWRSLTAEAIDRHWHVNFRSSLLLAQKVAPAMAAKGWGRIIGIGSIQEVRPNPALVAYAATKAAQATLIATLARELGPSGVTANNLAPGAIATDRNAAVLADPEYRDAVAKQIPAGRIGQVDDCVGACLLLASEAGSYINGQTLFVDGGWHL
jgi:NAD(P)-dependent dehydrogenase (short-subunit alcohol dehydrogenase family)